MNNTRKAIIELINEYMDKTLSEGCLFKSKMNWKIIGYKDINKQIKDKNKVILERTDLIKILWHYDISAVLKYIEDTKKTYNIQILWKIISFAIYKSRININIPNKPLHLYTEQEETTLLELLTNLKNETI